MELLEMTNEDYSQKDYPNGVPQKVVEFAAYSDFKANGFVVY